MNTLNNYKKYLVPALAILPMLSQAQDQTAAAPSVFSNALFNTMLGIIIFLLILIVALTRVLKNLSFSDIIFKKKEDGNNNAAKAGGIFLLSLLATEASAQSSSDGWAIGGLAPTTFYAMLAIIIVEVIFLGLLIHTIKYLLRTEQAASAAVVRKERSILDKINASVDIEKEADIMMGHEYDGIRELDNDLPPWWRYGFYLTILIAVIYLIHYHVINTGDLQLTEYHKAMEQGKAEVEAYMKKSASNVDENSVKMMAQSDIEAGKNIFITNCATCHGKAGEGNVGPNLTDDYWLHQGSLGDIFKSIKYGWTDKGMKSWKEDLSPVQIAQVTSFIKSLRGTNPPNAKAQQGDLYQEKSDSTKTAAPMAADSLHAQK